MKFLQKFGKLLIEIAIVSVITAIIAAVLVYGINAVSPVVGVFAGILTAVITLLIFTWSLQIHKGKETFLETIPVIVLAAAMVELLRGWFPMIPSLVVTFSWSNLAILLSSLFLADNVVKKYILK